MALRWYGITKTALSTSLCLDTELLPYNGLTTPPPSNTPAKSPFHAWNAPIYGARQQFVVPDVIPILDLHDKKHVQEVLGTTFHYNAHAIKCTMLLTLGTLATQQGTPTMAILTAFTQLLNYCSTNPEATLRYTASDMHGESDASFLAETRSCSQTASIHFLNCKPMSLPCPTDPLPPLNGALYMYCQILKEMLSSASKAKLSALFHNYKEAYAIRNILAELGHPQPSTPIVTDNSTASGIANDTIHQKHSKAMDMHFYWVRNQVLSQGQFLDY